jgi:hypothetical protein
MQNLSAHALRTGVIGAAMADPTFLRELRADSARAIEAKFGPQPYALKVSFEEPNEMSFVIPYKTEQLEKVVDRAIEDIGERAPTLGQFHSLVAQRAWRDGSFLTALTTDPRGTLNTMLSGFGGSIPADKTPRVLVEGAGECVIVLPTPVASEAGDLTDQELELVAGGEMVAIMIGAAVGGAVAGAVANSITGEWVCG